VVTGTPVARVKGVRTASSGVGDRKTVAQPIMESVHVFDTIGRQLSCRSHFTRFVS
jgi:hypothetical protein